MRHWLLVFFYFLIIQKTWGQSSQKKVEKKWFCKITIQDKTIDFSLVQTRGKGNSLRYTLVNGKEIIPLEKTEKIGDSLYCPISVFESKLIFPGSPGASFSGYFVNAKNQRMPFNAGLEIPSKNSNNINPKFIGNWKLYFHDSGIISDSGILITRQSGQKLYGTILTETGDYRYLNGSTNDNSAYLQTLDGGHSYRFDFETINDSLKGSFIYGPKGTDLFFGIKTKGIELKDGFENLQSSIGKPLVFKAKDFQGNEINQDSPIVKNKALVIQVLGTWCPNCMDETRFLASAYSKKPENVEFIGLAFERKPDLNQSFARIEILKSRLKVPYPIYWGGKANKDSAQKALPILKKVFAFPTTIFIKEDGLIYKVHSGFSGPATGKFYDDWTKEFFKILEELKSDPKK